jgi:hypothetical protein
MPRYFFHVVNGEFLPDTVGHECSSDDDVKAEAARAAGAMIREQGLTLWKTGSWIMFVCDEQNRTLLKLQFDAADLTGALSEGDTH